MKKPSRRTYLLAAVAVGIVLLIALAFRSPPVLVETATVSRGEFRVTVEEQGRTRLDDRYQVAAPTTGFINRVTLQPGDKVERGQPLFTVTATELDPRARAQAQAMLARAEAALSAAKTQVEVQKARAELAQAELKRLQPLAESGHVSQEALDRAETENRQASAALRTAGFAVDVARHEQQNAQAALATTGEHGASINVLSPISGEVLTRHRQSEGPIQAGEPVLTLGDLASLEVEVDLLSSDAVRIRPGMPVELLRWGGDEIIPGSVQRVEPAGFLHYSALGVEEQRVWVIVDIAADRSLWQPLGDGYRVEARFILWQGDDVLQVPASALFREGTEWATYVVDDNTATRRTITPGRRSGLQVEVREGLQVGEQVVLHPGEDVEEGKRLEVR